MANKTLIQHPHITEKASMLAGKNQYVFVVSPVATGPEVAKAIVATYKVKVASVRMINAKPKEKRIGRSLVMQPGMRKAIVTLKKGEKLDILTA